MAGQLLRMIGSSSVLNILNNPCQKRPKCLIPAGNRYTITESYRDDGLYIGSRMYNAAEKPYIRVMDGVKAIGAAIRSDVGKLIILGIANDVDVDIVYRGRSRVDVVITVMVRSVRKVVNLTGTYSSETWVWN